MAGQLVTDSKWTKQQREKQRRIEQGFAVAINMKTELALLEWAKKEGVFVRVDRQTVWGNPYKIGRDGDRDAVCDAYEEEYWPDQFYLHCDIVELRGKALGCHCKPKRCHADFLADLANRHADSQSVTGNGYVT